VRKSGRTEKRIGVIEISDGRIITGKDKSTGGISS
jgi:hypothetical protein